MKKLVLIAAIAVVGVSAQTHAGVVLAVLDATVSPSGSGSFEVIVRSDESPQPEITAFQLAITVPAGISIKQGPESTEVTSSSTYLLGAGAPPISAVSLGGTRVDTGNFLLSGSVPLFDNAGLVRVNFEVPASTSFGTYSIEIQSGSSFLQGVGGMIPVTFQGGSIDVVAVPEPSSSYCCLIIFSLLIAKKWWTRR